MAVWTIEKIAERCVEYCKRCGVDFNAPISINGRLTRTLGRCFYERDLEGAYFPTKIEISRSLLETASDFSIEEVIAHECAHYVTCELTHEYHGHDKTFRFYCEMMGTTNSSAVYQDMEVTAPAEKRFKYTLYCSECGSYLCGRHRACEVTKNPWKFSSSCCHAKIKVSQNW